MIRDSVLVVRLLVAAVCTLAAGCGPTCPSTCRHIFDPSECGYHPPGIDPDEQIRKCVSHCETALDHAGDIEEYDPETPDYSGEVTLENEKQAAAWMDCVWEHAPEGTAGQCEDIAIGYCAPVNF